MSRQNMKCQTCKGSYHYCSSCGGISEFGFNIDNFCSKECQEKDPHWISLKQAYDKVILQWGKVIACLPDDSKTDITKLFKLMAYDTHKIYDLIEIEGSTDDTMERFSHDLLRFLRNPPYGDF